MKRFFDFRHCLLLNSCFLFCLTFSNCSKDNSDLGLSYVKDPDTNKVMQTNFGVIPVNQFVIIMDEDYDKSDADEIAQKYGGSVVGEVEYVNLYQIETAFSTEEELRKALNEVSGKEGVIQAVINGDVYLRTEEYLSCDPLDDPVYKNVKASMAFDMMNLKDAWKYIKAGGIELSEVKVGVIDDGIYSTSREIYVKGNNEFEDDVKGRESSGMVSRSEISVTTEQEGLSEGRAGHSNRVIGIIAANNKNGGLSGVASVLGNKLKVTHMGSIKSGNVEEAATDTSDITQFHSKGKSYFCTILADLKKQVEQKSKVINCSFGTTSYKDKDVAKAFRRFLDKMAVEHPDVVFVAAGGNDNHELTGDDDFWGSKSPNLITVGAVKEDGSKANFSNYAGPDGEITISTYEATATEMGIESATSFCAPQVTGVVALLKSLNPGLSANEIKEILKRTATKEINGKKIDTNIGGGHLNASEAVLEVINDVRKKKGLKPLTKQHLIDLATIELVATGGPEDFTVTATVKAVSDKGTTLEIEVGGSNFALKGDHAKTLSDAGSVSWDLSLGKGSGGVTVKVKRLDTDGCGIVILGGELKTEDLVGEWTGTLTPAGWSASNDMIRQRSAGVIEATIGKPKSLTFNITLIDEASVGIALHVAGGTPISAQRFSFEKGKLHSEFFAQKNNFVYDAAVDQQGKKLVLTGFWSMINSAVSMNGSWEGSLEKK